MTSQGDGGGGYSLIGVTSWGDGCAVDLTFGVYARVGYYVQWIASQFGYAGKRSIMYISIYYIYPHIPKFETSNEGR